MDRNKEGFIGIKRNGSELRKIDRNKDGWIGIKRDGSERNEYIL